MRTAARSPRREAGFTLVEVIIVMAIVSVLMGFGIGMFKKLLSVGKATQARNSIVDVIQQVKTSSMSRPAALVLQPGREDGTPAAVYGLVFRPIEMSSFEPSTEATEAEAGLIPGLAYKTGRLEGQGQLMHYPMGRTGGCLVFEKGGAGGVVNFGNYEDYDLVEGVSISVWVYPTENRAMTVIAKGESYGINLKPGSSGPKVEAYLTLAETDKVTADGRGTKEVYAAPNVELVMNRWNGIEFHYDRATVTISIDSFDRGAVERFRKEETRPMFPDREADLTLGSQSSWCLGRVDDLKVSGILSGEPKYLPDDVDLLGERRTIRFVDGKLDPAVHRATEEIVLRYQGVENPIRIGVLGNIIFQ